MILAACLISTFFQPALHAAPHGWTQEEKKSDKTGGQDDRVRLHSDLVVINATVTDPAGGYAHGLGAKDFRVLEDGAPQSIDTFSAENAPFAAAVLIDMSGSMEYKFGLVRAAAASFIEHIREDDQVAVYGFNTKVWQLQDFSNSHDISDYVWDAKAEDSTRLYDCIDAAIEALAKRPEKRRAVLLISDGCDNASRKATLDLVMKKALSGGMTIYTVDLIEDSWLVGGGSVSGELKRGRGDLQEFARQTGGRYVHSPQGDKLEEAFTNIVEELRNQYTLTYYSGNNRRDGRWRTLSVSVTRPGLTARTRRGYFAPRT